MKHSKNLCLSLALAFSAPLFSEPPNMGLLNAEVRNYHDTGLYKKELQQKINLAHQYVIEQALLNQKSSPQHQLALVLDIDETSLSNYDKMVIRDFAGNREQIHKEIMAANSSVIKPTLALYKDAIRHGIKVFFVTGRPESERDATIKNLISAGYADWSGLYLRPNDYSQHTIVPFKSKSRADIEKQGYTIVASIGDQDSDIKGGYTQKGFKLPNPYYYLP